ncbi:nucleotidyltransferase family protein [Candidatus Bipolaricaulota sp. J31]
MLTLVVMAAGVGSRYGGPKQLEPIGPNGETFSDYSVYDARRAGFSRVVFILSREVEDAFRSRVGERIARHCHVDYVIQRLEDLPPGFFIPQGRKKPWGTAHAILSCKGKIQGPFAVINADDFYGPTSFHLLADFLRGLGSGDGIIEACLVGYRVEKTLSEHGPVTRGVCEVDGAGYLVRIQERRGVERRGNKIVCHGNEGRCEEIRPGTIVSMNMWGFSPEIFAELEVRFPQFLREHVGDIETAEFLLPEVVGDLVDEGRARVKVLPTEERWFGITYREDLEGARERIAALIRQGVYPEKLWN